jgi:membrane-associated phospholipid phosphatase
MAGESMSRSEALAVFSLLVALALVASFRWFMPLDEVVYQWVQFHRSCALDPAMRWVDPVVRGTLALLIACAVVRDGRRSPWYVTALFVVFISGAAGVELLKTAIERLRPNSTPEIMSGNSFPSGHTTGAAMAAAIAIAMIRRWPWRPWLRYAAYAVAAGCVVLQAAGRLVNGSHWTSDVIASALLGTAWVFGAGMLKHLPRGAIVGLVAGGFVAFIVFDDVPTVRFHLPSAMDERRAWLASIEFGTPESRSLLVGDWEDGPAEPIGPVAWARSSDVSVLLRGTEGQPDGVLKMTLRPARGEGGRRACARMSIRINEWVAPEISLARGWREYHIEPPSGVLRGGDNTIRFRIESEAGTSGEDAASGLAAFRYLRLYPRA